LLAIVQTLDGDAPIVTANPELDEAETLNVVL